MVMKLTSFEYSNDLPQIEFLIILVWQRADFPGAGLFHVCAYVFCDLPEGSKLCVQVLGPENQLFYFRVYFVYNYVYMSVCVGICSCESRCQGIQKQLLRLLESALYMAVLCERRGTSTLKY